MYIIYEYIKQEGKSMPRLGETDGNNLLEGVANRSQAKVKGFQRSDSRTKGAYAILKQQCETLLEQVSQTARICVQCNF